MNMIKLLYIDLFCGAGGTSTGVESARHNGQKCAKVIACVNHDANAIASHEANHPDALHFTEDIRTLELSPLVAHVENAKIQYPAAKVVLWASLECTNFSKAKGGKPRDADSRTLAEHLFRYIEAVNPDFVQIENVEEFMSWGDLDSDGKPISRDSGRLYNAWVNNVKGYGYDFDYHVLNAADYGAYTSRKRFFGQFAKHMLPIAWPEQTHAKNPTPMLFGAVKKWQPVKDVLDFADEGESIFTRKKPLSERTLDRIYSGLIKFIAGGKDKWLLKYNSVSQTTGVHIPPSIDEPCPVVSCQGRLGVVQAKFLSKYYSGHPESKNYSVEEPAHTITPIDHNALINARFMQQRNSGKTVQAQFLSAYYGNGYNHSMEEPCPVVTTIDRFSKIAPQFIDQQYGNSKPAAISKPLGCITANPKHNLVTCQRQPWVMNTQTANRKWHYLMNPQFYSAGGSVDSPCFTLIGRMDKMPPYLITNEAGQVAIEVYEADSETTRKIKEFMAIYGIIDIKMRMLKIQELKRIMGFPNDYALIGSQAEQKKYIGNAVEVNMARVLCEALVNKIN
jgi:DNA (cytosine-5)-methyltransferase 1